MISEIPSGASTRTVALSLVAVASCSPRRAGRAAAAEDCARRAVNACSTRSTRLCNESRSASRLAICESRSASRLAIWLLRTVRSAALNAIAISSARRRAGVAATRSIRVRARAPSSRARATSAIVCLHQLLTEVTKLLPEVVSAVPFKRPQTP
eukprot:scaffold28850_cov65-Phaeocystis_antarctica.AAC.1